MGPDDAGRRARSLEPLHAMIYFAPEAEQHLVAAGLEAGRMGYFASRSAAMGPVGAGVVAACFYNFNPALVAEHLPRAWSLVSPPAVLAARLAAADEALRRLLGDEVVTSAELAEAAELTAAAARGCVPDGRPLYAAHASLAWPEQPHLVLWHALSLLREFRGDGHVIALQVAGLDGLAALITHTATGTGFTESFARTRRGWSTEQWSAGAAALVERGLLDTSGALTQDGSALRRRVEQETDRLAFAPWSGLGAERTERLARVGGELSRQIIAAGCFPKGIFANE